MQQPPAICHMDDAVLREAIREASRRIASSSEIALLVARAHGLRPDHGTAIKWVNICNGLGMPEHRFSSFIEQWCQAYDEQQYFCATLLAKKKRLAETRGELQCCEDELNKFDQAPQTRMANDFEPLPDVRAFARSLADRRLGLTRRKVLLTDTMINVSANARVDYKYAIAANNAAVNARTYFREMEKVYYYNDPSTPPLDVRTAYYANYHKPWSFARVKPQDLLRHEAMHVAACAPRA